MAERIPELQFILKIASRCNLNCEYCYVYNKGDTSWRSRPTFMAADTFGLAVERIREHCERSGQEAVRLTFHGGEPTLVGADAFRELCEYAHARIDPVCILELAVQTNGTLIDEAWVSTFRDNGVTVGLSLDGPRDVHDRWRVDHSGRGSYDSVRRALDLLLAGGVPVQVLCVVQLGADGRRVHQHLLSLGVNRVNYLFPDFTHDQIAAVRERFGPTPVADVMLPILDEWWRKGLLSVRVSPFVDMARVLLGGDTYIDLLGNRPYRFVFVEADGSIEGLDVLRICGKGLTRTGLNVADHDFMSVAEASTLHRRVMFEGSVRPSACAPCSERDTCGGGYLPHRFSNEAAFDNPSVWCRDLLAIFARLRDLTGIAPEETKRRRQAIEEVHHVSA